VSYVGFIFKIIYLKYIKYIKSICKKNIYIYICKIYKMLMKIHQKFKS